MKRSVRRELVWTVLLLSTLVTAGASGKQALKLIERHPTPENIPEITDPRFILRENPKSTFIDEGAYEAITIGVEEGEFHEMFGEVADIAAMGDGTLLVLDSENQEVRVFDYNGLLLGTFGQPGRGPGEFRNPPSDLSVADQRKVVFVAGFSEFLVAFERQDATTFIPWVTTFPTALIGEAGCAMNGYYWFLGYTSETQGVLHKFTYRGERVASFLDFYKSPRIYISHRMSRQGSIACSEAHGIIALNRVNAPVVTGYKDNGEIAWQVRLADLDPIQYAEHSGGTWGWDRPKRGQGIIRSLFTDSTGDFYVQYMIAEGNGFDSIPDYGPLFKIDALTGEGAYMGHAPPVKDIDAGYVFSASNDPFPRVVIYKPQAGSN